jgi:hypothetical protein
VHKKEEVTGRQTKLHNEKLPILYFSLYIIRLMKSGEDEMFGTINLWLYKGNNKLRD